MSKAQTVVMKTNPTLIAIAAVLVWLGTGSPADAVSLSMSTDKSNYTVGENIVVTVTGDTTGGAAALGVYLEVVYDMPGLVNGLGAVATQDVITSFSGYLAWLKANPSCLGNGCTVLNQLAGLSPLPPDAAIITGTLTIPTVAPGTLTLIPSQTDFFFAPPPPSVAVTITSPGGTTTTTLPPVDLDVGIDATKLVIVDKLDSAGKAKAVFVAKTPDAAKGPGTDPDSIVVVMDVSYTGSSAAAGQFVVPAGALSGDAGWKANKDTVAKFVNKAAPGGPTGAKVAVIKPSKLLKLVGKSLGDTPIAVMAAGAPNAAGVDVVYTVSNGGSTVQHCTNFAQDACAYKSIAGDTGAKLVCKNGTPATCP